MKSRSGFTLIEILVVITVISILVGLTVFSYNTYLQQNRDTKRESDLDLLAKSMNDYYQKTGNFPVTCSTGTGLANDCTNLGTTYPSSIPITISPNMTSAQFVSIFPRLGTEFVDPLGDNTVSPLNKTTGGVIQPKAYYLLSLDMVSGTFSQTFASPSGNFTCNFTATTANYLGNSANRPKSVVYGYFSDAKNTWVFFFQKPTVDQDVLSWNTGNNALCKATEITL